MFLNKTEKKNEARIKFSKLIHELICYYVEVKRYKYIPS